MTTTAKEHASLYLDYLKELLDQLDEGKIADVIGELDKARQAGRTIFAAGNGGSAATASHLANDLAMISIKYGGALPFKVISISDNFALISAISNDIAFDDIYLEQLKINYKTGDVLIVISASGNSPNVVKAAEWVKQHEGTVIGFLGFDGGRLLEICNHSLLIDTPKGKYGHVEDIHMVVNHLIATWFQGGF